MGIVTNPESELGKEIARWDRPRNKFDADGRPGMRCVGYEPFPVMVYRAKKLETGKVICCDINPATGEMHTGCTLTVHSDLELDQRRSEGWRDSPKDALAHFEALEREIAQAAAEAQWAAQRMSDKAQAELKAANDATSDHVVDVTARSKKRGADA